MPFDVRTQLLETSQDVPTNEGLVVHLDGAQPLMELRTAIVEEDLVTPVLYWLRLSRLTDDSRT